MSEARYGAIYNGGIDPAQFFITKPQLFHHTGPVIFKYDIAFCSHLLKDPAAFLRFQIQGHAPLIPVQIHEIRAFPIDNGGILPGIITSARHLNLYNLRAHISQHHSAVGTCQNPCQVKNFYTC